MLAVAFDLPSPFLEEWSEFDELDELLEFVVAHLADLVESRIARGLYRSYVKREDNLDSICGRIAVAEGVRRNYILRHRTFCKYSEFTWYVLENQILRHVSHLVAGWIRKAELRTQLRRIDHLLGEVSPTNLTAIAIDRFAYHRLNDDSQPMHQLCRLFLTFCLTPGRREAGPVVASRIGVSETGKGGNARRPHSTSGQPDNRIAAGAMCHQVALPDLASESAGIEARLQAETCTLGVRRSCLDHASAFCAQRIL
jgi:McrBC 5-methylcytosine restriction system component